MQSSRENTASHDRRQKIAERYLRGEYQTTIAADLGINQAQVSRDLKAIRQAWLASQIRDFDAAKAQELAKIDHVEAAAWVAWARSTADKETIIREADANQKPKKAVRRTEGQAGDATFLRVVLDCIERRCKILGLDAPQRFAIKWDELTAEQEERLARGEPPEKVLAA